MWQTSHTRHTQRGARRRNLLGVVACLSAAVFAGVLIGRLTDDELPSERLVLNETAPPAAALATPSTQKKQPHAGRIARETTAITPRGRTTAKPTRSPSGEELPGFTATEDPTQVLGDKPEPSLALTMAAQVVTLTNAERTRRGCAALRVDSRLTRSARTHALEMARTGRLDHASPDGSSPGRAWNASDTTRARPRTSAAATPARTRP